MSFTTDVNVEVDMQEVFDDLETREQQKFLAENLDCADRDDIISFMKENISFEEVASGFEEYEVEAWIKEHAEDYGLKVTPEDNEK